MRMPPLQASVWDGISEKGGEREEDEEMDTKMPDEIEINGQVYNGGVERVRGRKGRGSLHILHIPSSLAMLRMGREAFKTDGKPVSVRCLLAYEHGWWFPSQPVGLSCLGRICGDR